jgi:Tfp pilus assembly protein PilO
MNDFLAQLNLTPQERRIVVAIGLVVIVVLNMLFVWPHFGEWKRIRKELAGMRENIEKYNKKIAQDTNPNNGLQKQLAKLVRQEGTGVMDKQNQLQSTIMAQSRKTGVNVANYIPGAAKPDTNGFFEEESIKISIESQESQLVSFLYNIGGDPAMIRVSELDLAPQDQNRYRLRGNVTLIANYANRTPAPGSAAAKAAPGKSASGPGAKAGTAAGTSKQPAGQKPGSPVTKPGQQPGQRGPTPGQRVPPAPGQRLSPVPGPNSFPKTPFVPTKNASG